MQHQACLDPFQHAIYNIFKLPLTVILIYVYNFIIIYNNMFLYFFLKTQTENNMALKETGKKRDRKRNFVPAKAGFITVLEIFSECKVISS